MRKEIAVPSYYRQVSYPALIKAGVYLIPGPPEVEGPLPDWARRQLKIALGKLFRGEMIK